MILHVWYFFTFALITACHIFVFRMLAYPRKSAVANDLKFNFLNFTKYYVTTVRLFEFLNFSRFDAL